MFTSPHSTMKGIWMIPLLSCYKLLLACFLLAITVGANQDSQPLRDSSIFAARCDETKCRSRRSGDNNNNNDGDIHFALAAAPTFDCWALEILPLQGEKKNTKTTEPFDCADGYIGEPIESVPRKEGKYRYYTCCSKDHQQQQQQTETSSIGNLPPLSRQCDSSYCSAGESSSSNETDCFSFSSAEEEENNMTCRTNEEGFNIPRPITSFEWLLEPGGIPIMVTQYTCCAGETSQPPPPPEDDNRRSSNNNKFSSTERCSESACTSRAFPPPRTDCIVPPASFSLDVEPMSCDKKSIYKFPRLVGEFEANDPAVANKSPLMANQYDTFIVYTCCEEDDKTSTATTEPFLRMDLYYLAFVPLWALSTLVFGILVVFVWGILSNERLNRQSFCLYLVALAVPDLILNFCVVIFFGARILNPSSGGLASQSDLYMSGLHNAYSSANSWLSATIAYEIFGLLLDSNKRRRAKPPTMRKVQLQSAAVYLYSIIPGVATHKAIPHIVDYRKIIAPSLVMITWGIPILYICYVCIRIWWQGLLPRTSRTRGITIYFARIIVLFLVMITPTNALACPFTKMAIATTLRYYLRALHGVVSVAAARLNPEIRDATSFFTNSSRLLLLQIMPLAASSYFFPKQEREDMENSTSQVGESNILADGSHHCSHDRCQRRGCTGHLRCERSKDEEVIEHTAKKNRGVGYQCRRVYERSGCQESSFAWPELPDEEDATIENIEKEDTQSNREEGGDEKNYISGSLSSHRSEEEQPETTLDCFAKGGNDLNDDSPHFSSYQESEVVTA